MHRHDWTKEPKSGERAPARLHYEQLSHPPNRTSPAMDSTHLLSEFPERSDDVRLGDPALVDRNTDLVLTGRKRSGKTYFAELLPHEPLGFSDPMIRVCEGVLGTSSKDVPQVRDFLVNVGALGRGESPPREITGNSIAWRSLCIRLRDDGADVTGMGSPDLWRSFGREAFWIDLMEERVASCGGPVAIHNARFPEEVERFTQRGFQHLHVMASENTRRARLTEAGEEAQPGASTERLARELDRVARGDTPLELDLAQRLAPSIVDDVRCLVSVVWSDERSDPPFSRDRVATKEQPDTGEGQGGEDVASLVHEDLERRVEEGAEEYGERLTTENGRDPLVDAYQEVLDTALYLRQELAERA